MIFPHNSHKCKFHVHKKCGTQYYLNASFNVKVVSLLLVRGVGVVIFFFRLWHKAIDCYIALLYIICSFNRCFPNGGCCSYSAKEGE